MVFGSRSSMAGAESWLYFIILSWISMEGAGTVVFRGESTDLYCPGEVPIYVTAIFWYKEEYVEDVTPDLSTRIAAYVSQIDDVVISGEYLTRDVTLSTADGHLHFPEILLSDDGGYTCSLRLGEYHGLMVTVNVRPSGFFIVSTPMPVNISDTINVICHVDEIRPEPYDFYWHLDGVRLNGTLETVEVDAVYGILQITNTLSHVVRAEDKGKTLTCVVVYDDTSGETMEARNIQIAVSGISNSSAGVNITLIVVILVAVTCGCGVIVLTIIVIRLRRRLKMMNIKSVTSASIPRGTTDPLAEGRNLQVRDLTTTPGVTRETAIHDRMAGGELEYEPVGVVSTGTEYERVGGEDNSAYVANSTEANNNSTVQPSIDTRIYENDYIY